MKEAFERLIASRETMFTNLLRRRRDVERVFHLLEATFDRDVSACPTYQRAFNGLYMVRRNSAWRASFYALLEREKRNPNVAFRPVLEEIARATGRIEASFASKLVATIRPEKPIYDSVVRQNLGLPERTGSMENRIAALSEDYETICNSYAAIIVDAGFIALRNQFDTYFPDIKQLADIRKLDLMFWQTRALPDG
jgi:hypothetical protein